MGSQWTIGREMMKKAILGVRVESGQRNHYISTSTFVRQYTLCMDFIAIEITIDYIIAYIHKISEKQAYIRGILPCIPDRQNY